MRRARWTGWRRSVAVVVAVAGALAVVVFVALVAARVFFGSARGRRAVERKVDQEVARHLARGGGHVHIGRVSGSLVGGATLDDVEWRDQKGRVALRARRVIARWSAARAIAGRPAIELRVEAPVVALERLASDVDLDEATSSLARAGEHVDAVTITRLHVVDATVRMGGLTLAGVDVAGALTWDRAGGRLAVDELTVHVGQSDATVSGTLGRNRVDVRLARLRIAPDDLRRLSPRATAPRAPITGEAHLVGPSGRARLDGELAPDRGHIILDGVVDLPARKARLTAALDDVETVYTPAVLAGVVNVRGALAGGAVTLDWRARGRYFRREVDPNLPEGLERARGVAAVRPGGRFAAGGHMTAQVERGAPAARMRFQLTVDDPGQTARLIAGPDLRAAPAPIVVDGDWRLPPRAAPRLSLRRQRRSP